MDRLDKINLTTLEDLFKIENLLKQTITLDTAKQINKLIMLEITEIKEIKKSLNKSCKNSVDIIKINSHFFLEFYKKQYLEIKNEIEKMMNVEIIKKDLQITKFKEKVLKQSLIYDELYKNFQRLDVNEVLKIDLEEYKNISVIFEIDYYTTEFFPDFNFHRLLNWLQEKKELSALIYKYDKLYFTLTEFSDDIKRNDFNTINKDDTKLLIEHIYFHILKMVKYFLICFYYSNDMNYVEISNYEISFATFCFIEFFFGTLITSILILYLKTKYSFVELFAQDIVDFQPNPYLDCQIMLIDNYNEKIERILNEYFNKFFN